ncbi:hypothetical protein EDC01DRAFT_634137 [Geopyxis carbonaria]|nr:hypothetical protein EDC01DRAFT_634137 [Geopyxis carbonaria]
MLYTHILTLALTAQMVAAASVTSIVKRAGKSLLDVARPDGEPLTDQDKTCFGVCLNTAGITADTTREEKVQLIENCKQECNFVMATSPGGDGEVTKSGASASFGSTYGLIGGVAVAVLFITFT